MSPEARSAHGFAIFLSSIILFGIYLIWILVPRDFLEYYFPIAQDLLPQKYWAIAFPIYCVVSLSFTIAVYSLVALILWPPNN